MLMFERPGDILRTMFFFFIIRSGLYLSGDDCHSLHLAVVGIAVKCQTMTCAPTDRIKFRIAFEDAHTEQVVSAKHNGDNNSSPRGLDNDFLRIKATTAS
ncbi:hypothetical protein IscW_ISCW019091, partial [Ixodes scapularis]